MAIPSYFSVSAPTRPMWSEFAPAPVCGGQPEEMDSVSPDSYQCSALPSDMFDFAAQMKQLKQLAAPRPPAPRGAGYDPNAAVDLAKGLKRKRSDELHLTPELGRFYWNPSGFHAPGTDLNDNNCANFVSAILRKTGGLDRKTHKTSVPDLEKELLAQGWTVVQGQPKPGDVWMGDDRSHVELVSRLKDGKVYAWGTNGQRLPDGSVGQAVSENVVKDGFYLTPPQKP